MSITIPSVTCPGCGCLCDDLSVERHGTELLVNARGCELGQQWFERAFARVEAPLATLGGESVDAEHALRRAAEILREARRPAIVGLRECVTETTRAVLGLADRIGALVLPISRPIDRARLASFQDRGRISATLGEVRARADVVVFWGVDPIATHPRHLERYSLDVVGRFVPEGRAGRTLVAVGDPASSIARRADLVVPLAPDKDAELAWALRLLTMGRGPSLQELAGMCELAPAVLRELADRLTSARYGAIFHEPRVETFQEARTAFDAIGSLVRLLNERTRFVVLGMGGAGNPAGTDAAITWQTGVAGGVDFRLGYPSPVDPGVTLDRLLARGQVDTMLVLGVGWPEGLPAAVHEGRGEAAVIAIAAGATRGTEPLPSVGLAAAMFGVETDGTVTRVDGLVPPMRRLRESAFPTDRAWVERLLALVSGP